MLKGLQRTKALSELNKIVQSKASLKGLAKTLALKKQNELRLDLGMGKWQQVAENKTPLNIDDIQPLQIDDQSKIKKAVEKYLSQFKDKYITTVDGKNVVFNSKGRNHLANDVVFGENIVAGAIEKVVEVLTQGQFIEIQPLKKVRTKDDYVAFHKYRKWVVVDNKELHLQIKVAQLQDGSFEVGNGLIVYSAKNAENEKETTPPVSQSFDSLPINSGDYLFGKDSIIFDSLSQDEYVFLEILEVRPLNDGQDSNEKTETLPTTAYQLADKATKTHRQKDNDTAVALMQELQNTGRKATADEKAILSRYTGTGGNLVGDDGLQGSDYEYYTPIEVASSMWDLAKELGFDGGAVLDPSAGTGIFKAAAPTGTLMHSVELSDVSGKINALINDDDTHKVTVSPFEQVASSTDDETFDMVITNVPFGTNAARGANKLHDERYQKDSLEEYFIKRSLDKLKPSKLAMFIVPTKILDGANYRKFRHSLSLRAELVGAYRLPNKVFDKTGADVTTDIIVLKKFDSQTKAKIDSLNDNGGQKLLEQAKVLDSDIIAGKYFKTYGKKFVLGEYETGKGKYGDVVRVVNNDSLTNILKLVRKFGDSRIDYALLEVQPVVEQSLENGDVRVLDGQTYEYQNGQWQAKTQEYFDETPFLSYKDLAEYKVTLSRVNEYTAYLASVGKKVPEWLSTLIANCQDDDSLYYWATIHATSDVLKHTRLNGYAKESPELTQALKNIFNAYRTKKHKAKNNGYKATEKAVGIVFGVNDLSDYWYTGQALELDSTNLNSQQAYENAVYRGIADNWQVDVEHLKQSNPDFDPLADDEFCINADGTKVTMAKDYYVGNYGEFLAKIDKDIEQATDPKIKEKLLKQKAKADGMISYTNVTAMNFGLMSRLIPMQIKYRFFNEFVDDATILVPSEKDDKEQLKLNAKDITDFGGMDKIDHDPHQSAYMRHFLLNRIFISINNNQVLTIDKANWNTDNEVFSKLNGKLSKYFDELNINFNAWLRTQKDFIAELEHAFNAPENKEFPAIADGTPFDIAGFKPKYENFKSLHDYQFEEVRRLSRSFSGICGFGVGLGKTSTALATIQNMHNIGIKKRTFIVVPNHTISKWAKDIANMYEDMSDVLVIGTDENKNDSADSKHYASDFALLTQEKGKKYRKILMTAEAFGQVPMREQHLIQYFDKDVGNKRSDNERKDGQLAGVIAKLSKYVGKINYFEDMAVDNIVMDEAQMYKNGLDGGNDFNRIAGLTAKSLDSLAARALSARAKSWWVRGHNKTKTGLDDGVVLLTATPFTNSPIEILTMLSLAIGEGKANKLFGGRAINSVDDFLSVFAHIESVEQKNIIGELVNLDMFTGFTNVELLKQVIHQVANIQTAKDRGLKIPDEEHITTNTELSDDDKQMLAKMKQFYKIAKRVEKGDMLGISQEQLAEYRNYQEMIKEPDSTIGHAFSMINRMSELTLVGSDMALNRNVIINFDESQKKIAQKVADEFNTAKKPKPEFKTTRNYPLDDEYIKVKHKKDDKTGDETAEYTVKAEVVVSGNRLILNVDDATMLANLMQVVEKHGLNIKPKLSAKVQALIENVKLELATPKHQGFAKQLIFCDVLSMHQILKQALISECGIPKSQIAILNAQTLPNGKAGSPDTEDVQEIQDLFADNHYTIVIANKKAETGIDLQKGTQAIHHLTTGWTPDSLEQRNGRGVRQGNTQEKVTIYAYNANGTFDEYKRSLIAGKASWIDSLMQKDVEVKGTLTVASQLSEQDYEDLIDADNAEAIAQIIKAKAEREKAEREKRVQAKNTFIFNNMDKARKQAQNTDFTELFKEKLLDDLNAIIPMVRSNAGGENAKAKRIEKAKMILDTYAGLKVDELWKLVQRKAEQRANSGGSSAKEYDLEDIFVDEQKLREEMNFQRGYASSEQWEELRKRKDQTLAQALDVDNEAAKRIKNIVSSRLEMLESTKQAFVNNDDSEYSRDEREAIVDGKAAIYNGTLVYHQDFVRYVRYDDKIAYAIAQVFADGSCSFITDTSSKDKLREFDKVFDKDRQNALAFFVDFDYQQARNNGLEKENYRFSSLSDEVRQALFAKIDDEKGNYDNEWVEVKQDRLVHKASGRAYGKFDVWQVFVDDDVLGKVRQAYYAPMAELLNKTAEQANDNYIHIRRKDVALFNTEKWVFTYDFYNTHLRPFLIANDLKINLKPNTLNNETNFLCQKNFEYSSFLTEFWGIERRAFTPVKEFDEHIKKLAYAKWGDVLGNIDELLAQGLSSVFQSQEINNIISVLGKRSDNDPEIQQRDNMLEQANAYARENPSGIKMIALKDSGWTLKSNKDRLKELVGKDDNGNYLYKWHKEQSAWYIALSKLNDLMSEDWFDFDRFYVEIPSEYQ